MKYLVNKITGVVLVFPEEVQLEEEAVPCRLLEDTARVPSQAASRKHRAQQVGKWNHTEEARPGMVPDEGILNFGLLIGIFGEERLGLRIRSLKKSIGNGARLLYYQRYPACEVTMYSAVARLRWKK